MQPNIRKHSLTVDMGSIPAVTAFKSMKSSHCAMESKTCARSPFRSTVLLTRFNMNASSQFPNTMYANLCITPLPFKRRKQNRQDLVRNM